MKNVLVALHIITKVGFQIVCTGEHTIEIDVIS